jgi:hypothetical protein
MKLLFSAIMIVMMSGFTSAQETSWRILVNNKTVISSHVSDESVNIKPIKSAEWKKSGYLEVNYKDQPESNWKHSLRFSDEKGNELLVKDNSKSAKVTLSSLRKLFAGKKQLKVYIVISPPNPMMAAPTRMVHLGTLKLP